MNLTEPEDDAGLTNVGAALLHVYRQRGLRCMLTRFNVWVNQDAPYPESEKTEEALAFVYRGPHADILTSKIQDMLRSLETDPTALQPKNPLA